MRKVAIDMIYELASKDQRVVFIGSDLAPGMLQRMKDEFPGRYYMEGITEQNIIGMATGLAMDGFIPYVSTIASFLTRRCYEQLVLDACLHHMPLRLVGTGGGLVYAPLGPTHLAIDDLALLRVIPNMTIVSVCDAIEMKQLMLASLDWPHPLYIRVAKGGDECVSDPSKFAIGKAILMRDCKATKAALLISTGIMTQRALQAAAVLEKEKIATRVLHIHTIKPLDTHAIIEAALASSCIVVVEEHLRNGGLSSAVIETLADARILHIPIHRLGIPDEFAGHYGSQNDLLTTYGLTSEAIIELLRRECNQLNES